MKNIVKIIGLFVLIVFSFFYSDKVASVISSKDSLMVKIDNAAANYDVKSISGIIKDNTIIPGIRGRKVNINNSYKKMREYGEFNDDLIVYDYINPSNSLEDNKDKFIISGNDTKNMVSIIFILDNVKYIDKLDSVVKNKGIVINYFVSSNFLISNSTYITNLNNVEIYNYGDDGKYYPDNLLFYNNFITRITNNKAIYCLSLDYDSDVLSLCSKNNLYTVVPNIIKSDPYIGVKNSVKSGSIILFELNNNSITELSIIIDYIKGKGLDIVGLSNLLSE